MSPARTDGARRFWIVGSQRSGTTLMRLVLECHSGICCYDELSAYRILGGQLETVDTPLAGLKVPQLTEQLMQPRLRDDEAVRAGERGIRNTYRGEPIIFMLRDARDVVVSMLQLRGWLQDFGAPVLDAHIHRDAGFGRRYAREIELLSSTAHGAVSKAALIWRYKTDALFSYIEHELPVLPVHYEAVVARPLDWLPRICEFLSVSWEPALLRHHAFPHGDLRNDGMATGDTNPRRAIDTRGVGRWQEALDTAELEALTQIAGPTARRLGHGEAPAELLPV